MNNFQFIIDLLDSRNKLKQIEILSRKKGNFNQFRSHVLNSKEATSIVFSEWEDSIFKKEQESYTEEVFDVVDD